MIPSIPPNSAVVSIPALINWIVLPYETISEYGAWHGVLITEEIAQWAADLGDIFTKHGHIERDGTKLYLWRRKDWESEYEQHKARKEKEAAERANWIDSKGRFKRLMKSFTSLNPHFKMTPANQTLAEDILIMLVKQGEKGNKDAVKELTQLGYYEELE